MTVHVEVDCQGDIMEIHEEMDEIERAIHDQFGILTTIHYDPIDIHNPQVQSLKEMVLQVVKEINQDYSIHDFRMFPGENKTNLIFDVLIPSQDEIEHQLLKKKISENIMKIDNHYNCVIEIDHSFV